MRKRISTKDWKKKIEEEKKRNHREEGELRRMSKKREGK